MIFEAWKERWPGSYALLGPRGTFTLAAAVRVVSATVLFFGCVELPVLLGLFALGVRGGTTDEDAIEALYEEGPLVLLVAAVVYAPLAEEFLFRFVPSKLSDVLLRSRTGGRWLLGTVIAALFAMAHNLREESGADTIALGANIHLFTGGFPVTQFLAALFFWHLMRTRGLWGCLLGHAVHNGVTIGLAIGLGWMRGS